MRHGVVFLCALTLLAGASIACGKKQSTTPSGTPTDATITITSSGVSPRDVTITSGGRVTFVNNDSVPHQPTSDPHPLHTDCPGINQPILNTGQSGQTAALTTRRTCGFHDHLNDGNTALQGTITVQ
jgi:plastocyanin